MQVGVVVARLDPLGRVPCECTQRTISTRSGGGVGSVGGAQGVVAGIDLLVSARCRVSISQ